jgi:hypothetical protein
MLCGPGPGSSRQRRTAHILAQPGYATQQLEADLTARRRQRIIIGCDNTNKSSQGEDDG